MAEEYPSLTVDSTTLSHAKTSARHARLIRDGELLSTMKHVVRQINTAVSQGLWYINVPHEDLGLAQISLLRRMGYIVDKSSSGNFIICWTRGAK